MNLNQFYLYEGVIRQLSEEVLPKHFDSLENIFVEFSLGKYWY